MCEDASERSPGTGSLARFTQASQSSAQAIPHADPQVLLRRELRYLLRGISVARETIAVWVFLVRVRRPYKDGGDQTNASAPHDRAARVPRRQTTAWASRAEG